MVSDLTGPDRLLRELRRLNTDLQAVALLGADGTILALAAEPAIADLMAPTLVLLTSVAARSAQELGRGALRTVVVEGSLGMVVGRDLGDGRVLAAIASA